MRPDAAGHAAGDLSPPRLPGKPTLAAAPIEVAGDWDGSLPQAA